MKLTIELDNGKTEVFQNVTDLYIAIKQTSRVSVENELVNYISSTASYSWGSDVRELVKEITQSQIELQDHLRDMRNGDSS